MDKYEWGKLNHLQLSKYAEYYVKMEFTLAGFDVYTSDIDDKGIDFIIRQDEKIYYDIQVKSVYKSNYIFFRKDKFHPRNNLLAVIVIFIENKPPTIYLIPSLIWNNLNNENKLFVYREYEGKKSLPEYGLNLAKKYLHTLEKYRFDKMIQELKK